MIDPYRKRCYAFLIVSGKMSGMDWQRLADYVVDARTGLGLRTREALAEQVGVSSRVLSDIENARRTNYDRATIAALERALGWGTGSVTRILAGGDPLPRGGSASNADMVIAMIVTALDFPGLDDHQRVRQIRGIIATDYRPAGPPPPPVENDQRFEAS